MSIETDRQREAAKYSRAYTQPNYHMKGQRRIDAEENLRSLPTRGSYLDVSCGRGEMLRFAAKEGFAPVQGTEIVDDLIDGERVVKAEAHHLPFDDDSVDVATMFDVIEHLLRGDDEKACRELARVARRHILITANNRASFNAAGDDLHINKRSMMRWDVLFRRWFPGKVTWQPVAYNSQMWRVDLG